MLKFISKLVLCSLTIFGVNVSLFAQNNDSNSLSNIGLFPKQESPELYTFKISGEYRFLGSYVGLDQPYGYNLENTIFIGDDSQLPLLTLRFSGRPSPKTSWGFDLYTYQFLDGNVMPTYGFHVLEIDRPSVYDPINGNRLAGSLGVQLGINFYGSIETKFGSYLIKAGGIHWESISDLTLASFKGYNRFSLFERAPWDPLGSSAERRYFDFYKLGNISQDSRWGEKPFTGLVIEGSNMPGGLSANILVGKTDLNGGFSLIPNLAYGGQLKKELKSGAHFALNTFNNLTYTDSTNNNRLGFNLVTLETNFLFQKFNINLETGLGRYISNTGPNDWGEALQLKIRTPKIKDVFDLQLQVFRISPKVINNNSVFINSAILEQSSNNLPAGVAGSTQSLFPFASSMVPLGMMTNNREGFNINTELNLKRLKLSLGIGSARELEAIGSYISFGHPVNSLTRSRFWRWNFPNGVGPYERYNVIYRDVYELVELYDDVQRKYFNNIEFQAKYHPRIFNSKLYAFFLSRASTVQNFQSILPEFSTLSYIRQYSNELELFFALREDLVFCSYSGIERTIANYDTEIDAESRRPRNQFGYGYGLGLDYTIAKNTALFIRHRWFEFEDTSFELDQFKGTETTLELKITF